MSGKMTPDLARRVDAAGAEEGVPVIVTLRPDADISVLERKGLEIQRRAESAPIVTGTLKAGQAGALAALDEVELIESDEGEMRALKDAQP
jgi:hypothetical protein